MAMTVCVMAICDHVEDRGSSGWLVGGLGQEHTFNFSSRPHTPALYSACSANTLPQHASSRWTLQSFTRTPWQWDRSQNMKVKQQYAPEGEFERYDNTEGAVGKEEGIRTPEWCGVVKSHGTGA